MKIRTEFVGGATFRGRLCEDGNTFSGDWSPDTEGPGNVASDIRRARAKS